MPEGTCPSTLKLPRPIPSRMPSSLHVEKVEVAEGWNAAGWAQARDDKDGGMAEEPVNPPTGAGLEAAQATTQGEQAAPSDIEAAPEGPDRQQQGPPRDANPFRSLGVLPFLWPPPHMPLRVVARISRSRKVAAAGSFQMEVLSWSEFFALASTGKFAKRCPWKNWVSTERALFGGNVTHLAVCPPPTR
jgi:hypothetical protein